MVRLKTAEARLSLATTGPLGVLPPSVDMQLGLLRSL